MTPAHRATLQSMQETLTLRPLYPPDVSKVLGVTQPAAIEALQAVEDESVENARLLAKLNLLEEAMGRMVPLAKLEALEARLAALGKERVIADFITRLRNADQGLQSADALWQLILLLEEKS